MRGSFCLCRACDNLFCTNCDFSVLGIKGFRWYVPLQFVEYEVISDRYFHGRHPDVDYMFFRNYMPSELKLRSKATRDRGMQQENNRVCFMLKANCLQVRLHIVVNVHG